MSFKLELLVAICLISFEPPTEAHDVYSPLKDRWGNSCCDDRDCQLAPYRLTARGVQMLVDRHWIDVPSDKIQYLAVPGDTGVTGGGHWCGFADAPNRMDPEALYITRCAILPPQSASADLDGFGASGANYR